MSYPAPEPRRTPFPVLGALVGVLVLATVLAFVAPAAPALAGDTAGSSEEATAAAERAPVILYMTSWCGWCRKTRELLTELDAPFEEVDIEADEAGRAEYDEKSGGQSGVPLIDIDGTLVRGYKEDRIRKLVAELDQA